MKKKIYNVIGSNLNDDSPLTYRLAFQNSKTGRKKTQQRSKSDRFIHMDPLEFLLRRSVFLGFVPNQAHAKYL